MTDPSTTVDAPVLLEPTAAPIKFVPQRSMFDREFEMSGRIKILGTVIAAAITIAIAAIFLFL